MASNQTKIDRVEEANNNIKKPIDLLNKISKEDDYDLSWLKGTAAERLIEYPKVNNKNEKADFSDPVFKKISRINGKINSMSMSELSKSLQSISLDSSGKKEVLQKRLKNYYKKTILTNNKTSELNILNDKKLYDYVCVIDYEATCSESVRVNFPHEIIEFPVVLVNMNNLTIVDFLKEDHFEAYCKPKLNPILTKFCTDLTGITQEKVDGADEFVVVLKKVNEWFESHHLGTKYKFTIATDGPWDMEKFLNLQCNHSDLPYPHWARTWVDVRKLFSNWFGVRKCGILKMLDFLGLEFEGQQHCGLDDSRNIARILMKIAGDGGVIKTNAKIKNCLTSFEKRPLAHFASHTSEPESDSDNEN